MTAPDWTLVELGANRIRYRENPGYREGNGFRFSLEWWNGHEWRPTTWNAKDWFAAGLKAGGDRP